MLKNYFKVAYRHLLRNKVFSSINVIGLGISIAAFFLILQYVSFEAGFDQFHTNKDEIYRVALEFYENGELKNTSAKNFDEIRAILIEQFPQIESVTGFVNVPANTGFLFSYDEKLFNELGGFLEADSNFFKVFPSLLVRGNPATALSHPNNIVISESMAKKIFGDVEPLGRIIGNVNEVKEAGDYVVTGVMRDIPQNAHFHANFIGVINIAEWGNYQPWNWFFYTYVTIPESISRATIGERLTHVNNKLATLRTETRGAKIILQPITDIHLNSKLSDELEASGNKTLVYVLAGIGVLILAIAWINYINLETARFTIRAREIGIRRIVGSAKRDLAIQFLVEYSIITTVGLIVAWLIIKITSPHLSFFARAPVTELNVSNSLIWILALALLIGGSILVGIYPSFFLMKLHPINALKGKNLGTKQGRNLRKGLVLIQFTASISLIALLMVINGQLDHILLADRKIDLDHVVAIRNPTAYMNQESELKLKDFETLENKLLQHTSIAGVATSSAIPGTEIGFTYVDLIKRNIGDPYDPTRYKTLFIDYNFINVYGLKMLAGRNYNEQNGEDENWETLILNEKAVKSLGFKTADDAIGQYIQFMAVEEWDKYKIVGVIEDYHHEAVKKEVLPMIFFLNHNFGQQVYYSIKINSGSDARDAITYIEESWRAIFPERQFEYFFIDEYYDQQFKSERFIVRIFLAFAGIAVFVGCLGIFGMTLFETNVRVKELSIRKVLGASVVNLVTLLTHDHVRIVMLSTLVSLPLIYFAANEWLDNYPTRINLTPLIFLTPLLIVLVMVIVTSCFQTIKSARANPVDHLKHE